MYALYNKEKKQFAKVEKSIDTFGMFKYCIVTDPYANLYYVLDDVSVLQRLLERSKSQYQGIHDGSTYETPECSYGYLDGYEIVKLGALLINEEFMKLCTCDDCGKQIPESEVYRNETAFGDDGDYCQDCFYENHYDFGDD